MKAENNPLKVTDKSEGNKIIAEFLEHKHPFNPYILLKYPLEPDTWKFHTSWDWLMPVWIKFRNLWYKTDKKDAKFEAWIDSLGYYLTTSDEPQRFFDRLVYAIKWYNQNSKQ